MTPNRGTDHKMGEVDLTKTYDAVIVGSGAAGGMAAHVLTEHGLNVLMLEAGKKLHLEEELKSGSWPYDHPRRGEIPPRSYGLSLKEYSIRNPPYAKDTKYDHVYGRLQAGMNGDYTKNIVVDEKDHPFTGTRFAWVRARVFGGRTTIWGKLALRLSDYDFKAKTHDDYGDDWPISYKDIAPYYDRVDRYLGISGQNENLPHLPDGIFQRPMKFTAMELHLRHAVAKMGRTVTPFRVGVTTDGLKHNKYRNRCYGCGSCNRSANGCGIHAAFDSPTGLIYPAMDTGRLTLRTNSIVHEVLVDKETGKAEGVAFLDSESGKSYEAKAKVVVLAASTLESARIMLLSKSRLYPDGIGNSSGHVGHNFFEHVVGGGIKGFAKEMVGKPRTLDDGRPEGFYLARFRNLKERHRDFIRGYGFEGDSGATMFPTSAGMPGFGAGYKRAVRDHAGAMIEMMGFGEVLPRFENYVDLDPEEKDRWGIPVLRFHYRFGDNELKMARDMADTAQEMFEEAGFEILSVNRAVFPEGFSIHELGTAIMGTDARTSVLNQFQQSHDVGNLFVVDGSSHVSGGCQNPTWTIMALCWRSCDYLAEELRRGNL